jgi:FAD-dependent urate hydroxylase
MKVLIAGAGVGGLALARGLIAAGHAVEVYEKGSTLRTGGAAVSVFPNGMSVLRDLGVSLDGAGSRIDRLEQRTPAGRRLCSLDLAGMAVVLGAPTITLPRFRLLQRLAEDIPSDVINFGAGVDSFKAVDRQVAIFHGDRELARGDVLVGADGHHSAVRERLHGSSSCFPTGWITWQGLSELSVGVTDSRHAFLIMGRQGSCGLMPAGNGLLQWWFDIPWTPADADAVDPMRHLRARFGHWPAPVSEVLSNSAIDKDVAPFVHFRQRTRRVWGEGRVTLVGDSAHTMPPSLAQGASQTLEDVSVLLCALRERSGDIVSALRLYESLRYRHARRTVAWASREHINRQSAAVALRVIPDAAINWCYPRLIRSVSNRL